MLSTLRERRNVSEAPPLTLSNVLAHVQGVRDWRKLGKLLLICSPDSEKLNVIQSEHRSDHEQLCALIKKWLNDVGKPHSWRWLICSLDCAGELTVADPIRGFAEPPQDTTLTPDSVIPIFKEVRDWRRVGNALSMLVLDPMKQRIADQYTTNAERSIAFGQWWVNTHYSPCWANLARALYHLGEDRALEKVSQYLPKVDPTLTTKTLMEVVRELESRWEGLARILGVRYEKIAEIASLFYDRTEAVVNEYVRNYPTPSWGDIAHALQGIGLHKQADAVTTKYVRGPAERRYLAACERAMKEKGSLNQITMHCVFMGMPRSGKTSLLRRLLRKRLSSCFSTGVAERAAHVEIRKSTVRMSGLFWCELEDLGDEAMLLMHDVSKTSPNDITEPFLLSADVPVDTQPPSKRLKVAASSSPNLQSSTEPQLQEEQGTKPLLKVFRDVFQERWSEQMDLDENHWTLYITDTGGQPEFQELLPILVCGPSLFFLVFRLDLDLNSRYKVEYINSSGRSIVPYEAGLTVQETLLQSLATIASTSIVRMVGSERVMILPRVFFVGTHKDLVPDEHLREIDSTLQAVVKRTEAYREGMVQFASESQMILPVNNMSDDQEDVQQIRAAVERIGSQGDTYRVKTPVSWHMFSNLLRRLKAPVVKYEQCYKVAQDCGISTRDEMNDALRFLHENVGVIRYYHDVKELREYIIKDLRYLFDIITDLLVATFTFDRTNPSLCELFARKGIFPLDVFEKLSKSTEFLPPAKLVVLLQHLNIVALLKKVGASFQYFIPCVLAHSECSQSTTSDTTVSRVPPLLVTFLSGYCPKGLFGAVVVYLLQNKMKSKLEWELEQDKIFRDQISLSVGPYDSFRLTVLPSFLLIEFCASSGASTRIISLANVCSEVRRCIDSAVFNVSEMLHCSLKAGHCFGFFCPEDVRVNQSPHPATVTMFDEKPCALKCPITHNRFDLPDGCSMWFSEGISVVDCRADASGIHLSFGGCKPTQKLLLQHLYHTVPDKWRAIGTYLEIPAAQLSVIDELHRGNPQKCLMSMLTERWLPRVSPPATWQDLAEAVEFVGHPDVAHKLRQKFCPP